MIYDIVLMHKNDKVLNAKVDLSEKFANILNIDIIDENLCPIMMKNVKDKKKAFKVWWGWRLLPETRREYVNIIRHLYGFPIGSTNRMHESMYLISLINNCLSLTDKYWINVEKNYEINFRNITEDRKQNVIISPKTFEEIDYFTNGFSTSLNKVLFYTRNKRENVSEYNTPSLITNGEKQKFWDIIDNEYYLMKYLYNIQELKQNEIIVNNFLKLNYPELATNMYIFTKELKDYDPDTFNDIKQQFVATKCFTTEDTEFISANEIILSTGKYDDDIEELFVSSCDYLEIPEDEVNLLIKAINDINKNFDIEEPRDLTNYGFIRDANTNKFIKAAPLFGNSYYKYIL